MTDKKDREPQEENKMSLSESIIEESKTQSSKILSQGNDLPAELIVKAEQKLFGFQEIKSEIDGKMVRVHEAVDVVRQTIRRNIHSRKSGAGFLAQGEVSYLACLEMQHVALESLLQKDEITWTENLEKTKNQADDIQKQLEALISKYQEDIEAIFSQPQRLVYAKSYTLRKLPLWGKAGAHDINFEWPTQDLFD